MGHVSLIVWAILPAVPAAHTDWELTPTRCGPGLALLGLTDRLISANRGEVIAPFNHRALLGGPSARGARGTIGSGWALSIWLPAGPCCATTEVPSHTFSNEPFGRDPRFSIARLAKGPL